MRQNYRQPGEVRGDVVEEHRVGIAELDAAATGQPGADPVLPGVEQRRDAQLFQRASQQAESLLVRRERLQAGVELEAAAEAGIGRPVSSNEAAVSMPTMPSIVHRPQGPYRKRPKSGARR